MVCVEDPVLNSTDLILLTGNNPQGGFTVNNLKRVVYVAHIHIFASLINSL